MRRCCFGSSVVAFFLIARIVKVNGESKRMLRVVPAGVDAKYSAVGTYHAGRLCIEPLYNMHGYKIILYEYTTL